MQEAELCSESHLIMSGDAKNIARARDDIWHVPLLDFLFLPFIVSYPIMRANIELTARHLQRLTVSIRRY